MDLSNQLDSFELKIRQLASKMERQAAEKENLSNENKQLKKELDRQYGVISSLKEKLERAVAKSQLPQLALSPADKPANLSTNSAEKPTDYRAEIDFCIQEIDKCIVWLQEK